VYNWQLRDVRIARKSDIILAFSAGDKVAIFLDDEGGNSKNTTVTIYVKITQNNNETVTENFNGKF
jgi:hypothetical protein